MKKKINLSDRLIEQFMVITNEVIAKHCSHLNLPFVYRVHEDPLPERIKAFKIFIFLIYNISKYSGATLKNIVIHEIVNIIFERRKDMKEGIVIMKGRINGVSKDVEEIDNEEIYKFIDSIDIEVLSGNEPGNRFWESLGFKEVSRYMRVQKI